MKNPYVSVIVPAYNAEKVIDRCIRSLLKQTIPVEILVVDNNSTDGTADIISRYAKKHSNVVYLQENRGGVSFARNCGLRHVKGEYVAFCDADDYVSANMYAVLYSAARKTAGTVDVVTCGYIKHLLFFSKAIKPSFPERCFCKQEILEQLVIPILNDSGCYMIERGVCNKLFLTPFLQRNRLQFPEDLKTGEDDIFATRALAYAGLIVSVPECLYHYRRFISMNTLTTSARPDAYFHAKRWSEYRDDLAEALGRKRMNNHSSQINRAESHAAILYRDINDAETRELWLKCIFEDATYKKAIRFIATICNDECRIRIADAVLHENFVEWKEIMQKKSFELSKNKSVIRMLKSLIRL